MTGIPPATLGGYFSGRHLPSPTQPHVLADVLDALGIEERAQEPWREALLRVRRLPGPRSRQRIPYRGLQAFDVADAEWFFGREEFVDALLRDVRALRTEDGPRLVFIVGVSGAGKSSVLRAGVMSQLEGEGVPTAVMSPGADPLHDLRRATVDLAEDGVLVVDQAEDALSAGADARMGFIAELLGGRRLVLLSLRADFYSTAMAEPMLLPHLQARTRLVGALTSSDLVRAVVEPARRAGGSVEPELVELLQRELATPGGNEGFDPGALPLLSHALLSTWMRSRGGRLTVTDYLATGGIRGAIRNTAEQLFLGLDHDGQAGARRLFSQLVRLDDDGVPRRLRLELDQLVGYDDALESAIDAFVRGRILTAGETTLDISHEALLEAWPRLQDWIGEDRDDLRIHRRVHQAARAWDEHGREDSLLMGETLLALAQGLETRRRERGLALSALEADFVRASATRQDELVAARRLRQRRTEVLLGAVAVLALVTSVMSVFALNAKAEADDQRRSAAAAHDNALSRQIASQAERTAESAPAAAAQLALAAYRVAPTVEARSALLDASSWPRTTRLRGPEGPMRAIPSPDGRTVAVVSSDGTARFWSISEDTSPRLRASVVVSDGAELYAAAYSPDGHTFAAGGRDGSLAVYDVSDPDKPARWEQQPSGPGSAVQSLAFSPDGRELAAATSDPALFRWRVDGQRTTPRPAVRGFGGSVQGVAYAPSGRMLATASSDGRVRLWRGSDVIATLRLGEDSNFVNGVAFSPDGRLLAAVAKDKRARVYDVRDAARPRLVTDQLTGFTSWVNGVAFSPDGTRLAAAASGGLTQVWDTRRWQVMRVLPSESNYTAVAFSPDGKGVITSEISGMARMHALTAPRLDGFTDNVWGLDQTRDGKRLYVGVGAGAPGVHEVLRHEDALVDLPGSLQGPAGAGVLSGPFGLAPDGRTLVAGTATGRLVVWRRSADRWQPVGALPAATQLIEGVTFAPDGSYFFSTSDDGSVSIYETGERDLPTLLARPNIGTSAFGLGVSPDSRLIAVGSVDRQVHLFRMDAGKPTEVGILKGFDNYVLAIAFSPDGRLVAATGADSVVRRWRIDGDRFEPLGRPLAGPAGQVYSLAFTPDSRRLAAAAQDGLVWLWRDPASADPVLAARLRGLGAEAHMVLFDPPGGQLSAGGAAGAVVQWHVDEEEVAQRICATVGAPITRAEWRRYVPGAPYRPVC